MNHCLLLCVLFAGSQFANAADEFLSWAEAVEKCGEDAWDDYGDLANECNQFFVEQKKKPEVVAQMKTCDRAYCEGVGGVWSETTLVCDYETDKFRECGASCHCMELYYQPFMYCTRAEIIKLYDHESCHASGMYECILDTLEKELVDECKRGVDDGRISWMDSPVPKDCDSKKICSGSSLSPIGMLAVLLTLAAIFFA